MLEIKELSELSTNDLEGLRGLLKSYGTYMYKELNLVDGKEAYFNNLLAFPDESYQKPYGAFLLAKFNSVAVGCVGMRKLNSNSCEMKRLFVDPLYRGLQIGLSLGQEIVDLAKRSGYHKMFLDTNREMVYALHLYHRMNFIEVEPYCVNINKNPVYLSLDLIDEE